MKYIVIETDNLIKSDQNINEAVLLWKNEDTLEVSSQSVMQLSYDNEESFRGYIKYNDDQIKAARDTYGKLPECEIPLNQNEAFASKNLSDGRGLFKRVHGESETITNGETGYVLLDVPYLECKFSGAEIIGCDIKDTVDFFVLDTNTNTYSQLPVETYGANFPLNQFGFNVEMKKDYYSNTSNYDASLYSGMQLMCAYKNNGLTAKYIAVNFELHEVK